MKRNRRDRHPHRIGFTLLEVIVVLFIIAAIAAFAVREVIVRREAAKIDSAGIYVRLLEDAVNIYIVDVGSPPTTEQGLAALVSPPQDLQNPGAWRGPYIKSNASSRDPWGSDYQYVRPGPRSGGLFDIWSLGPDGVDGTDDDIGTWMPMN